MKCKIVLGLACLLAFSPAAEGEESCAIRYHNATKSEKLMAARAANSYFDDKQYPLSFWRKAAHYEIAYIDLNDDGKKEIIIKIESGDWCGSAGCISNIYESANSVLNYIGGVRDGAVLWKSRSHGYHNLSSCGGQSEIVHIFDGKEYSSDRYFDDDDMTYHADGLTWTPAHPPRPDGRSWCELCDRGECEPPIKYCNE